MAMQWQTQLKAVPSFIPCCCYAGAGLSAFGQHGYGYYGWSPTPQQVVASGFIQISAAVSHSCGVLTNGAGLCWGEQWFVLLPNDNAHQHKMSRLIFAAS
jgi:hypothetical protein